MCFYTVELFLAYTAAALHEGAHILACKALKIPICGVDVGIFGVRLKSAYIPKSTDRIFVSASGPVASFVIFGILYFSGIIFDINNHLYKFFSFVNLCMGLINLLPVFPLDGGVLLKALMTKYLGFISGGRLYAIFCSFFNVFLLSFFAGIVMRGVFTPSFFMILIFIIKEKRSEKIASVADKKAVLSGEIVSKKKFKYIACDSESELLCLASRISSDYTIHVAAFSDRRFAGDISQMEIIDGIRRYGALCTVGEYINNTQN